MRRFRSAVGSLRCRKGQSLVEFTLAVPIAVFLILATVEMGQHFYTRITVRHAVQEAGRYATTGQVMIDASTGLPLTRAESIKNVLAAKAIALNIDVNDITLNPSDGGGPDEIVQVSLNYTYDFGPAVSPLFFPPTMDITVSTSVKNEPVF